MIASHALDGQTVIAMPPALGQLDIELIYGALTG
jgi:hypothetical protein